jgi:hypothetical protein
MCARTYALSHTNTYMHTYSIYTGKYIFVYFVHFIHVNVGLWYHNMALSRVADGGGGLQIWKVAADI